MKGKVVLVAGANGGLGTHVTQAFLDAGATVVRTSRKIQQSDFSNPNFTAIAAEISTRKTLVDQVVARFGKLDVLRRVFNPTIVDEAKAPSPLVSSHSRRRAASRSRHVSFVN